MKSQRRGKNISVVEVSHISIRGIWLYLREAEYFLPFEFYPWFKDATISEIHNVQLIRENYLRWDDLDVDLLIDSLDFPEKFPLIFKKTKSTNK